MNNDLRSCYDILDNFKQVVTLSKVVKTKDVIQMTVLLTYNILWQDQEWINLYSPWTNLETIGFRLILEK